MRIEEAEANDFNFETTYKPERSLAVSPRNTQTQTIALQILSNVEKRQHHQIAGLLFASSSGAPRPFDPKKPGKNIDALR